MANREVRHDPQMRGILKRKRIKAVVLALLATLTVCAAARAQDVPVPQEFLSSRRESGGDKIRLRFNFFASSFFSNLLMKSFILSYI